MAMRERHRGRRLHCVESEREAPLERETCAPSCLTVLPSGIERTMGQDLMGREGKKKHL